ncbi:hypothetical protein ACEWY4_013361 [Coilia grayii]|uniref:Motilin/ghrelin-associated peptide domain-containing protein n=1 Tax=Coilia grayii TaxID=363190 RepID=A0ABD1JWJ0_9TELE
MQTCSIKTASSYLFIPNRDRTVRRVFSSVDLQSFTMLLWGGRASRMIVLVCSVVLLMETVTAGSSFLSPAQKPQGKGKPPRVGRRDVAPQETPQEDVHSLVSPPFRLGMTMTAAEYEEHGPALQRILDTILGDTAD